MSRARSRESRRRFLTAVPAALAGAAAGRALAQGTSAGPVKASTVQAAEVLTGVDIHAEDETAVTNGLNTRLRNIQQLRQTDVPLDTELAVMFNPVVPGREPKGAATPNARLRYSRPPGSQVRRPANLEDVAFWPVSWLAALVERRLVTSTELTQMYLARLKRLQPTLNFYVTLTEELALKQAADADREIQARRYRGPLHGLPWGAKDLFATKGIRTTFGAEPYVDQVIDYDATVVERLRDAGAVLVAKLTLGALAQGDRWFGGRTLNPWNQGGASGSSAGPGSATAAGCVAFAIGTETRGSIISPSTANGVVGLRPTYGRVSRYGAMALSNTMDKAGPMCRYVEDTVLVLNAIYGPDGRDLSVADAAFQWNPSTNLSGVRVGYVRAGFEAAGGRGGGAPVAGGGRAGAAGAAGGGRGGGRGGGGRGGLTPEQQEQQRQIYRDVLDVYRSLGATLVPVDLPDTPITNQIGFILEVEAAASFDDLTRSGDVNLLASGTSRSSWPNTFKTARFIPAVEYLRAQRARTILMRQWDGFMRQFDVLLSAGADASLSATNLTGHPAMAVKCGFVNDTPRILMLTGQLYDEATLCRVALAYEQATEWKDRHPGGRA